ncbi:hypothetical protein MRX96_017448 [Rhipicephalus microplus]
MHSPRHNSVPTPARPSRHPHQQSALQFLPELLRSPRGALSVTEDRRASRPTRSRHIAICSSKRLRPTTFKP